MDIAFKMTEDHREINEMIENYKRSLEERINDIPLLNDIRDRLRWHTFVEETILFPMLGEDYSEDVKYLEIEHRKILEFVGQLELDGNYASKAETCRSLLDLLNEHNGFEESFVYDNYSNLDAKIIEGVKVEINWNCKFCRGKL